MLKRTLVVVLVEDVPSFVAAIQYSSSCGRRKSAAPPVNSRAARVQWR